MCHPQDLLPSEMLNDYDAAGRLGISSLHQHVPITQDVYVMSSVNLFLARRQVVHRQLLQGKIVSPGLLVPWISC